MTHTSAFVGIDVSKERLDIHIHPTGETFSVANHKHGLRSLQRRLSRLGPLAAAVEASGGYERAVLDRLAAAGLTAFRLDPAQVKSFARLERQRAKTDAIDAGLIARCLAQVIDSLEPYRHDPAGQALAELVAYRRTLVEERSVLKARIDQATMALVRRLLKTSLASLNRRIALLDKAIAKTVAEEPRFRTRAAVLATAPGAGPVLIATLLARLPELGEISSRQIASLLGVAPYDRQSGARRRPGRCQAGRGDVRKVVYMATLAAIRRPGHPLRAFYRRLTGNGKPPKLAILAAMRKFVTHLNAMLRDQTSWNEPTCQAALKHSCLTHGCPVHFGHSSNVS